MDNLYALLAQIHRLSPPGTPKPLAASKPRTPRTLEEACRRHAVASRWSYSQMTFEATESSEVTLEDLADDERRAEVTAGFYFTR